MWSIPCRAADIRPFDIGDPDQGIVHVNSPERGNVLPGLTLVCPDGHTGTQGALGALAWGIGSTEAEHALATVTLRVRKPLTMRITVAGRLGSGVTAKDLALALIGAFGAGRGSGHIVEFAGEAVEALDIEARLTLCTVFRRGLADGLFADRRYTEAGGRVVLLQGEVRLESFDAATLNDPQVLALAQRIKLEAKRTMMRDIAMMFFLGSCSGAAV